MIKYIAILTLLLFCQVGYSLSMDKLFSEFAKLEHVKERVVNDHRNGH